MLLALCPSWFWQSGTKHLRIHLAQLLLWVQLLEALHRLTHTLHRVEPWQGRVNDDAILDLDLYMSHGKVSHPCMASGSDRRNSGTKLDPNNICWALTSR